MYSETISSPLIAVTLALHAIALAEKARRINAAEKSTLKEFLKLRWTPRQKKQHNATKMRLLSQVSTWHITYF
jgi:hypothetical protein